MNSENDKIINEAKRIEEDSLYSARGHFEAAKRWRKLHYWIGVPLTMFAVLSTVSYLNDFEMFAITMALLTAILSALLTFLNPMDRHNEHKNSGNSYKSLCNDSRIFAETFGLQSALKNELLVDLKKLNDRRNSLNSDSPLIPPFAYNRAKKGIEDGQSDYIVDKNNENR